MLQAGQGDGGMTEIIQISTKGSFKVFELKLLTQCIRDIEQNNRSRHIDVFMNLPDKTVKEIEEINDSIKPGLRFKAILKDGIHG